MLMRDFKSDYDIEAAKLDKAVKSCKEKLNIITSAFYFDEAYNGQAAEIVFQSGKKGLIKLVNGKPRLFVEAEDVEEIVNKLC